MDWTHALIRFIDFQTFANVWYWLAVIVTWSVASNWLLGVPFDMLLRARKLAEAEVADLEALVAINVRRIVSINRSFGAAFAAMIAFSLTMLFILAVGYRFELAQGLLAIAGPLTVIMLMNMQLAHQLDAAPLSGRALIDRMLRVRLWTQVIGMVALFFTAMFGMYSVISSQLFF